jgi:hypothetical protein
VMFLEPLSKIIGFPEKNWRIRFLFHVVSGTTCSKGTNASPAGPAGHIGILPVEVCLPSTEPPDHLANFARKRAKPVVLNET